MRIDEELKQNKNQNVCMLCGSKNIKKFLKDIKKKTCSINTFVETLIIFIVLNFSIIESSKMIVRNSIS